MSDTTEYLDTDLSKKGIKPTIQDESVQDSFTRIPDENQKEFLPVPLVEVQQIKRLFINVLKEDQRLCVYILTTSGEWIGQSFSEGDRFETYLFSRNPHGEPFGYEILNFKNDPDWSCFAVKIHQDYIFATVRKERLRRMMDVLPLSFLD